MPLVDPFIPHTKPRPKPKPAPPQPGKRRFTPPQKQPPKRIKSILQSITILLLAVALGLVAQTQALGELAILVYALVALALRFSSRTSFTLALLAFIFILILEIASPQNSLSVNFAVYAFLLLVVGCLSLSLEVRQEAKWQKIHKRKN
jgi:hypothetical protein